jgi:hypothetical protein
MIGSILKARRAGALVVNRAREWNLKRHQAVRRETNLCHIEQEQASEHQADPMRRTTASEI